MTPTCTFSLINNSSKCPLKNSEVQYENYNTINILNYFLTSSFYKNNKHTINAIRGLYREIILP